MTYSLQIFKAKVFVKFVAKEIFIIQKNIFNKILKNIGRDFEDIFLLRKIVYFEEKKFDSNKFSLEVSLNQYLN